MVSEGVGAAGEQRGIEGEGVKESKAGWLKLGPEKRRGPEQFPSSQGPEREW